MEKVNHPSLPDHPDHALYEKYFPNGGASIFTFNITVSYTHLLGRGGKAAAGLERTAGFIEINLVIKINRRGSTLGK